MGNVLYCAASHLPFVITEEEQDLYARLDVPLPTLSPDERTRRMLARRNERVLYKRLCSATQASIVSIHAPEAPFPVYAQSHWWSDAWDPFSYGRPYDFSRGFFEQFADLYRVVPQIALNSPQSENSEWTNQSGFNKNCYMFICGGYSENCMYGMWNSHCQHCIDCGAVFTCTSCYELFNCYNCYQCLYSDNLEQCSDCLFCRELVGCTNCIGCVGLQHQQYQLFNTQLTPEEFARAKEELRLYTREGVSEFQARYREFEQRFPRRYQHGKLIENSDGDYLVRTENVHNSYNIRESRNLWHCRDGWKCYNSASLVEAWMQDHCIEIEGSLENTNSGFCNKIWESGNTWYSSHIYFSKDIFGCVGLKNAEYCILNTRYSPNEYHELRARIIAQMKSHKEWGEHFPIIDSPFPYNVTIAQQYYPLSQREALLHGYRWETRNDGEHKTTAHKTTAQELPPTNIREINIDELLSKQFRCTESGKIGKFQRAELEFYTLHDIPLPTTHHDVRFAHRMASRRNPRKIYERSCSYCNDPLLTSYAPELIYAIACEKCFGEHRERRL